ncbi:MAG TPA: DUF3306 domain-containing protein [Aurantimonas sp.]|uniref:DUF3306 domain-containing protein n=1 Tax=Aurantimonas marianensis TaxID=2920428 RepID=A0A9X2H4Q2_9HYPH|nr:DUF3306 domain-containing protein [Aurantimonas marianensis]MCP3054151.1 DUF3306 domain-containing protein [Aurantimonas marianensis]
MADDAGKPEGFLSRWSRRKRDLEDADPAVVNAPDECGPVVEADAPDPEAEENRMAAEAVDIDSLVRGDDFSIFLKRGVPELLRKQALRKLWRTDPVFANLDGLNDYDEDFRNPAHNVYKSLWQVGRGFLSLEEQETQQATGRMSRELAVAESAGGEAEPVEAVSEAEAEPLAADETAAISPDEHETPVEIAIESHEADEPAFAAGQSIEPEEAEQPRRRVSIRSRLEG